MKAMEKIKLSKERVNLIADLKSGNLKGMAKIRASKRVVEIVVLLGGSSTGTPSDEDAGSNQDAFIKDLQAMLGGYELIHSGVGASFSVAKDAGAIKVSAGFTFRRNTPTGFTGDKRKELQTFWAKVSLGLSNFAKANNFDAANGMSESAFLGAVASAAQRKEELADSNGDPIYSDMEQSIYVDNIFVFDGKAASGGTVQPAPTNPLYQSVLDGAAVTIDLVKQVRAEGQKDPDHPQLRPAVRVIVETVKAMAA